MDGEIHPLAWQRIYGEIVHGELDWPRDVDGYTFPMGDITATRTDETPSPIHDNRRANAGLVETDGSDGAGDGILALRPKRRRHGAFRRRLFASQQSPADGSDDDEPYESGGGSNDTSPVRVRVSEVHTPANGHDGTSGASQGGDDSNISDDAVFYSRCLPTPDRPNSSGEASDSNSGCDTLLRLSGSSAEAIQRGDDVQWADEEEFRDAISKID